MRGTFDLGEPIGRDGELALAEDLIQATLGDSSELRVRALLVGGESGIGKTTFVNAVGRLAADGGLGFTIGHCLDLASDVPFGPILEALRAYVSQSAQTLPSTLSLDWLEQGKASAATSSLDGLVFATESLARTAPFALIIEDAHWADASVRDFTLALLRTCRAPILLIVTYRTDELHRGHPFRGALVELARSQGTARIELKGLAANSVAEIVRRRTTRELGAEQLATLTDRSGGNPLHVEELLGVEDFGIPLLLHDLLLRHVDRLSARAVHLVRLASVGGTLVDPSLLREASDLTADQFDASLNECLDTIIVRNGPRFSFRHALLREAIYRDLLPAERASLHEAYAAVLQAWASAGSTAEQWAYGSALALHASEAHDLPLAFEASVRAGLAGQQYGAAAAADHFDRALELWDQVSEPESRVGLTKADMPRLAARVLSTEGVREPVSERLRQSVELLEPEGDPLAASRVYTGLGQAWVDVPGLIDRRGALERAISLAGAGPNRELAEALVASAQERWSSHEFEAAYEFGTRGLRVAQQTGERDLLARAHALLALALWGLGRCGESTSAQSRAALEAEQANQQGLAIELRSGLAYHLLRMGTIDEGLGMAQLARAWANRAGLSRDAGLAAENEVTWLIWNGQFAAAEQLFDELCVPARQQYRNRWFRSMLETARGNAAAALAIEQEGIAADECPPGIAHSPRLIDACEALPDPARMVSTTETMLDLIARTDSPLDAAVAASYGYRAQAVAAAAALEPPARLVELCTKAHDFARSRASGDWSRTWYAMHLALANGYQAHLAQRPSIAKWRTAVELATPFGRYTALRPRIELARAQLRQNEREPGKDLLRSVWHEAYSIGAGWFAEQAAITARKHRVHLPLDGEVPGPLARLTPREREVLDLLAAGATNRAIASALFITEKTASLHVGNVISKLGVTNRGQAAAIAREGARRD